MLGRILLNIFLLLLVFIMPMYLSVFFIILVALTASYTAYEVIFFGILFDIVWVPDFPVYTFYGIALFLIIQFARKRMSFHV